MHTATVWCTCYIGHVHHDNLHTTAKGASPARLAHEEHCGSAANVEMGAPWYKER